MNIEDIKNEVDEELEFAIKEYVKERIRELKYQYRKEEKNLFKAQENLEKLNKELNMPYGHYRDEFYNGAPNYTNYNNHTPYQQYLQESSSTKIK